MTGVFHHIYFLPWIGFFTKLEYVDFYVVLDDVGFRRNHIKRVKLLNAQGDEFWLCLPVGNNWGQLCNTIKLPQDKKYIHKHLTTIQHSYGNATYFGEIYPFFKEIYTKGLMENSKLVDANLSLLIDIRNFIDLKPIKIIKSSNFNHMVDRTERIISISKELNIKEIIIGGGKMKEVHDIELIRKNHIDLLIQDVKQNVVVYKQIQIERNNKEFVYGLSILDILFNLGKDKTKEIILRNEYIPRKLEVLCQS